METKIFQDDFTTKVLQQSSDFEIWQTVHITCERATLISAVQPWLIRNKTLKKQKLNMAQCQLYSLTKPSYLNL